MKFLSIKNNGFTLIELLVVISIISLLSSVVLSATGESREKARIAAGIKFEGYTERNTGGVKIGDWTLSNGVSGQAVSSATVIDYAYNTSPTVVGDPTYSSDVPDSSVGSVSVNFDGSDAIRVESGNPNSRYDFDTSTNFSIGAWFRTTAGGQKRIASNGHQNFNGGYLLQVNSSGQIWIGLGNPNAVYAGTQETFIDGKWHYVLAHYNRTDNKISIYVDGKLIPIRTSYNSCGTYTSEGPLDISACTGANASNTGHEFCIGAGGSTCTIERFVGNLVNVVIYEE